jgi:CRP-like cAMP-binding protein
VQQTQHSATGASEREQAGLEDFLPFVPEVAFAAHEPIYKGGADRVYYVSSGRVLVQRNSLSNDAINVGLYGPGEFFGEWSLDSARNDSEVATAHAPSTLMSWPTATFRNLLESKPEMSACFTEMLLRRQSSTMERLTEFWASSLEKRLALALLRFSARLGFSATEDEIVLPPLTHELLAAEICTSREVVTGRMSALRAMGVVRYSRKSICIIPSALRAVVAGEPIPERKQAA